MATILKGLPFLFNDQSVYYLMLSVEGQTSDGLGHGVTLDYKSELFLSMYGSPNRLELKVRDNECFLI